MRSVASVSFVLCIMTSASALADAGGRQMRRLEQLEPAEPNDERYLPGTLSIPEIGEVIVLRGCITPADFDHDGVTEPDVDAWSIEVVGSAFLAVDVEGVDGLTPGFSMALEPMGPELAWAHVGADFAGATTHESVFVPAPGSYLLSIMDTRSLLMDIPTGGAATCYTARLEQLARPDARAVAPPTAMNGRPPQFYTWPAKAGRTYEVAVSGSPRLVRWRVSTFVGGQYQGSILSDDLGEACDQLGPYSEDTEVTVLVDTSFDATATTPEFGFRVSPHEAAYERASPSSDQGI